MPSLFSRFKHRKTPSQSSADLNSPPTSPSTAQSPTAAVAGYSATPASPSQARQTSGSGPLVHRSDEDVVVVDRGAPPFSFRQQQPDPIAARDAPPGTTPPYRADPTGHSRAFADESERPELPTTSSNVNNPIPSGARTPVSKDLPELPQLPRDLSAPFSGFPLPPGAAPASPTPPPPAIPHVSSVDRSRFINAESERPKPIVAASQGLQEDERGDVGGQFGHVKSIPNVKHGWRSQDTNRSRRSIDAKNNPYRMNESEGDRLTPATVENQGRRDVTNGYEGRKSDETRRSRKNLDDQAIPARGVSLVANPPLATGTSENATAQAAIAQTAPTSPRESLRSHWGNHVDGDEFINQHIANLFLNDRAGQQYEPKTTPGLETAREDMTAAVITSSRAPSAPLCEAGRQAFIAVGMGDKIGITNTVDVRTQWIEPVVQETVRRTEHTDTLTYVDRDIHKYHVYPKIQPIYDPEPLRLATRHRIFSPEDGQWHEVIGDQAAIDILGEDAFYHGQKQTREVRGMVMPGLDGKMSNMTEDDLLRNGLGTGYGMGRVLERDGVLHGRMGPWREVGTVSRMDTENRNAVRESRVGLAL